MSTGLEWLIDAEGCDSERLCNIEVLRGLCDEIVSTLALRVVGNPVWHQFPDSGGKGLGGITGMYLLSESHLTCHTFPEFHAATLNLYCCRPSRRWNWESEIAERLAATGVSVRSFVRGPSRAAPAREATRTAGEVTGQGAAR
jgi:S-adenosylmethionine decarboxylase